jgi:ribonuclease HII
MLIAGIDDAGRGPIIGPLVIAGVLIDEKDMHKLKNLGVKDSKVLSPKRREFLAVEIRKLAVKCHWELLSPAEIDKVVETGRRLHRLNRLEADTMARVINVLKPDVAYVDASDVMAERFGQHIIEKLSFRVKIVSEHRADATYPVVSAASIIAKVQRDQVIMKLAEKYAYIGDIGSGYASDPRTIIFLEKWFSRFRTYPEFVRKSWKPAKELKGNADRKQTKLQLQRELSPPSDFLRE